MQKLCRICSFQNNTNSYKFIEHVKNNPNNIFRIKLTSPNTQNFINNLKPIDFLPIQNKIHITSVRSDTKYHMMKSY